MSVHDVFSSNRRRTIRRAALAAALLVAGVPNAALAFESPDDGVFKDRIDWGVIMDLSGPTAASQRPWVNGVQSYTRMINEAGGVGGRKINVLTEDNRYDATVDRVAYEKFATQTPALGVSGLGNSSAQVALVPLIKRLKLPVVGTYVTTKAAIDPPSPYFYGSFCGFKEMAQVGVGYFTDSLKLKAPKVATVHLDVASGKEFIGYMDAAVAERGGTSKGIPIKVVAADATPQVLEIVNMKPDFIAIHGTSTTAILVMKALAQYGLNIPTFAITYLGGPSVYGNLDEKTGASYHFVSCFSPASADEKATAAMSAAADKYGFSALKDDINFVAGWVVGQLITEAIAKAGPEPTREKLAAALDSGFELDTKGVSSALRYTKDNHLGLTVLRPFAYDYATKKYKSFGEFKDFEKYTK